MTSANGRFLIGVLLGGLLGGVAVYLAMGLSGGELGPSPGLTPEAHAPSAKSVNQAEAPDQLPLPGPGAAAEARRPALPGRPAPTSEMRVQELLASADRSELVPDAGTGVFSGLVTDSAGVGVADVVVVAERRAARDWVRPRSSVGRNHRSAPRSSELPQDQASLGSQVGEDPA